MAPGRTALIYIGLHALGAWWDPRQRMKALAGLAVVVYMAAFAAAVYDRITLSDWLASHLMPL